MGQAGAGGTDHADDVDVVDAVPLVVGVVLDGALGADARVVDQDVEAAEFRDRRRDGRPHGRVVGDVRAVAEEWLADRGRVQVEDGDLGAALGQEVRGGPADAGGTARHQGPETLEVAHAACPFFVASRSAAQKPPPGYV